MVVELRPTALMSCRATTLNPQQPTNSLSLYIFQPYVMYFKGQSFIFTVLPFAFASVLLFTWFHCRAAADEVVKLLLCYQLNSKPDICASIAFIDLDKLFLVMLC